MVLAVSLVLGAISLMGLSQGGREQRGYQALSRAAVTGINDELSAPGGLEDSQPQHTTTTQIVNLSGCSIHSGASVLCSYLWLVPICIESSPPRVI